MFFIQITHDQMANSFKNSYSFLFRYCALLKFKSISMIRCVLKQNLFGMSSNTSNIWWIFEIFHQSQDTPKINYLADATMHFPCTIRTDGFLSSSPLAHQ